MPKKKKPKDPFSELTWGDLEAWAGHRIVTRGKNYQRQGHVSNLFQTAEGGLVAWVEGTKRYATLVEIDEHGDPESVCTCPYGNDCKHAVATVLEYLAYLKADSRMGELSSEPTSDPYAETTVDGNTRFAGGKTDTAVVIRIYDDWIISIS